MPKNVLLDQPKPFYMIFVLEFWERFGFYGVQALIVLFMVQKLKYSDMQAVSLFTSFSALVYLLPGLGGYIGDKILGTKRTILLGAIVLAIGYLILSLPNMNDSITLPMAIIVVGNWLFKANPSSLLSKIYQNTDHNLDSGFTLYYMAINVGALISMSLIPILSHYFGWHVGFLGCFIGLIIAIVSFIAMRSTVKDIGTAPKSINPIYQIILLSVIIAVSIAGCNWLLIHYQLTQWALLVGGGALLLYYLAQLAKSKKTEKGPMLLCLILIIQAIVYFVLYNQMPTSLTLFVLRNVEHSILGIPVLPGSFQGLNSFWIMAMSPILAIVYNRMSNKGTDFSLPGKFALGTFLAGLGYLVLPLGTVFSDGSGIISSIWVVLSYFFQSVGELMISAIGLSMVAQLIPQRLVGFVMGFWFLCTSIAGIIAGKVANLASIPSDITDPIQSLPIYNALFLKIGIVTVVISLAMGIFVPLLKKLLAPQPIQSN